MSNEIWEQIKKKYKQHITTISNKGTNNETLTFWNGCMLSKYDNKFQAENTLKRVEKPTHIVKRIGPGIRIHYGWEWPLKSKIKWQRKP